MMSFFKTPLEGAIVSEVRYTMNHWIYLHKHDNATYKAIFTCLSKDKTSVVSFHGITSFSSYFDEIKIFMQIQ